MHSQTNGTNEIGGSIGVTVKKELRHDLKHYWRKMKESAPVAAGAEPCE
jgi:hypothetical protein